VKVPVGWTYIAHAVIALAALAAAGISASMTLGRTSFGEGQALGMLFGMFAAAPAALFLLVAVYSGIAVVVTVLRKRHVPVDMVLLPCGLILAVIAGSLVSDTSTKLLNVVAMSWRPATRSTLILATRYRSSRRHSRRS
jgi:hypothetical protein